MTVSYSFTVIKSATQMSISRSEIIVENNNELLRDEKFSALLYYEFNKMFGFKT